MAFLNWLGVTIGNIAADRVIARMEEWDAKKQKIQAIGKEATDLIMELDNASGESESKAVLRKLSNFSDLSRLLLLRDD